MELSHRVVIVLSAQVQQQTNKTASEMLSSCLKFKLLPSLKLSIKVITIIRLKNENSLNHVNLSDQIGLGIIPLDSNQCFPGKTLLTDNSSKHAKLTHDFLKQ